MSKFQTIALEFHSDFVWDFDWVRKCLEFIRRHGFTSLVFHNNDVVDLVTYPALIFGGGKSFTNIHDRYREIHRDLYTYAARERRMANPRRDYLQRILHLAKAQGPEHWPETKAK